MDDARHAACITRARAQYAQRDACLHFSRDNHAYHIEAASSSPTTNVATSVTTFLHEFFPPFDGEAALCATPDAAERVRKWGAADDAGILAEWDRRRRRGTALHEAIEFWLRTDGRPASLRHESEEPHLFDEALASAEFTQFLRFEREVLRAGGWRAYRVEWRLFDADLLLAGTIDALFHRRIRAGGDEWWLVDWKRTPRFYERAPKWSTAQRGWGVCAHLPNAQLVHYTLQQNLYRALLRRNYDVDATRMTLVRFHPDDVATGYELPEMRHLADECATVAQMLEQRRGTVFDQECVRSTIAREGAIVVRPPRMV